MFCNRCHMEREVKSSQYSSALKMTITNLKPCGHWIQVKDAPEAVTNLSTNGEQSNNDKIAKHSDVPAHKLDDSKLTTFKNCPIYPMRFENTISKPRAIEQNIGKVSAIDRTKFYNLCETDRGLTFSAADLSILEDAVWQRAFPFQRQGVEFAERRHAYLKSKNLTGGVLIADEMALGKTIQALLFIRRMIKRDGIENAPTVLFVFPSHLAFNWPKEYMTWAIGDLVDMKDPKNYPFIPIIKIDGTTPLLPGFKFYFVSQDVLRKKVVNESISAIKFDLLVIDESHRFKNTKSARTEALMDCVEHIPFKLILSGTPITNRFTEYFTALHLCSPTDWPDERRMYDFAEFGPKNQILGLRKYKTQQFFDMTANYVIRRKRADVMKDLPPVIRDRKIIAVNSNKKLVTAYNHILDEIEAELNSDRKQHMFIIAKIQELRHLTGLMKVAAASDFIEEFTLSKEPGEKLAIGCHHHDVEDYFVKVIKTVYNIDAIHSNGKDNVYAKMEKERQFRSKENRFAVLGILAWGEGRNLQFCPNALIVEREWTPAMEEQFELRFSRPLFCTSCLEKTGKQILYTQPERGIYTCPSCNHMHVQECVTITYMIAKDTIDEFFDELVEMKRAIKGQVMDASWSLENDPDSIQALAMRAVSARMKYV